MAVTLVHLHVDRRRALVINISHFLFRHFHSWHLSVNCKDNWAGLPQPCRLCRMHCLLDNAAVFGSAFLLCEHCRTTLLVNYYALLCDELLYWLTTTLCCVTHYFVWWRVGHFVKRPFHIRNTSWFVNAANTKQYTQESGANYNRTITI